jgi:hypothetical protein
MIEVLALRVLIRVVTVLIGLARLLDKASKACTTRASTLAAFILRQAEARDARLRTKQNGDIVSRRG